MKSKVDNKVKTKRNSRNTKKFFAGEDRLVVLLSESMVALQNAGYKLQAIWIEEKEAKEIMEKMRDSITVGEINQFVKLVTKKSE